jgi:hypothetical protein
MADEPATDDPPELPGDALFADIGERFITPEVARRRAEGSMGAGDRVWRYQLLLPPGQPPVIRLNEEVRGEVLAEVSRDAAVGDEVYLEDIVRITGFEPEPEERGTPYIAAFAQGTGWMMSYDLSRRHPLADEHLALGADFAASAREAHASGRVGVALDCAYSAAELLAKTELLSCSPTIETALSARKHAGVVTPYTLWAHLGNTEQRFASLLHRLGHLRPPARYLNGDLDAEAGEVAQLMATLAEMERHVHGVVTGDPAHRRRRYQVIATRELRAGRLARDSDCTIVPSKTPAPEGRLARPQGRLTVESDLLDRDPSASRLLRQPSESP